MVYFPIDPTTTVPTIERASARPEPIQSTAPADSFNEHLERAQTKEAVPESEAVPPPTDDDQTIAATGDEEPVQAELTEGEAHTDSTEGQEAAESEVIEEESVEEQDVVEISSEAVLVDELESVVKQEDAESNTPNQAASAEPEPISASGKTKNKQGASPEKQADEAEFAVTKAEPSEADGESQQVVASTEDDAENQQELAQKSDEPLQTSVTTTSASASKGQEGERETSTETSHGVVDKPPQQESDDTNSEGEERRSNAHPHRAVTKSKSTGDATDAKSSEAVSEQAKTTATANAQPKADDSAGRDQSVASQDKPQAMEKIEGSRGAAPQPSGEEPTGVTTRLSNSGTAATKNLDANSTEPPPSVNRVRFIQRVARAFQNVGREGGEVRLRLSPPELGALRLEVTVQRGVLSARMETETSAARALILDNIPALRERLEQQDIKIANFDVDLMDQPPEGMQDNPSDDAQWQREYRERATRKSEPAVEATTEDLIDPISHGDDGALNVVV